MATNAAGYGDDIYRPSTKKILLIPATCCRCGYVEPVSRNKNFTGLSFVCIECLERDTAYLKDKDEINSLKQYLEFGSSIVTNYTRLACRRLLLLNTEEIRKKLGMENVTKRQLREILKKHNT